MRIQHNIMAMNAYRNYNNNTSALSGNLEKLSSGYKINRAGDDAAGLAISEKMRAQISGLDQAQSNVKDGISLVKTGEGALQEVQDMLNRMVTLATQSANGTYDDSTDRANLQKEVVALKDEIDRIADSSNFNGINLLDGTQAADITSAVTGWGNESSAAVANIQLNFGTGTIGSDLIGGKVIVGKTTINFKAGPSTLPASQATIAGDAANTIYVGANATAATVVGVIKSYLTGIASVTSLDAEDVDGNTITLYIASSATSGGSALLILKASSSSQGKELDALTIPELKVSAGLNLQIGDTSKSYNKMNVGINDMHCNSLYIDDIDISDQDGASSAINRIKNAINMVSSTRGDLGAVQNRLEHTENNLSVMAENIQDAESTIRDTDVAEEMMSYTKNNILVQSAQAMLAQANTVPQGVLQLLQ
jgi:flagellin